ncbi:MAG: hypothetical protein IJ661_01920 [Lachnospiraceae bacterium]|nr:hypothetical protein [Lachnospiraceae bacterium]
MARLLRAEWYRYWRSSHLWIWYVVFLAETLLFAMWEFGDDEFVTFTDKLAHLTEFSLSSIIIVLSVITAVSVAMLYHNKTGYYQVISGHKISHILLSKILIDGVLLSLIWVLSLLIYYTYYGMVNGVDDLDNIPIRIALVTLAALRVEISGVLMAEIIEHPAAGVLAFVRFMFVDGLFAMLVNAFVYDEVWNFRLHNLSALRYVIVPATSPAELAEAGVELPSFVIPCILTFLLEVVFWYIIAYTKMKRKGYR